jgi:hypothetical protein
VAAAQLGLPAVGGRVAALDRLELRLGRLELLARAGVVDVGRLDGVVDERDRAVLQHLEEAGAGRELEHVAPRRVHPRRPGLERRDQRRMAREHADLAGGARHDDHLGVALVRGTVRRHDGDREDLPVGHYAAAPDICCARSTAPSIGPTM